MADENTSGETEDQQIEAADAGETTEIEGSDEAVETLAVDAAADTLAADDSKDPFTEFDGTTKEKPAETAGARTAVETVAGADADDDLTTIEAEAAELDAELGAGGKAAKLFKRLADRDRERNKKLKGLEQHVTAVANSAGWTRFSEELGIPDAPIAVRSKLTTKVIRSRFEKHYNDSIEAGANSDEARGEARATLKAEVRQIIAKARKAPVPKVLTNAQGARLTPPGGAAGRATKPSISPELAFDKGTWDYPN